jgi:hypothetical protein
MTNVSKARPRGIAASAKAKKSARIQSILAHGPAVHVDPQIADDDQDELGNESEHESVSAIAQPQIPSVGFSMVFYDFWICF